MSPLDRAILLPVLGTAGLGAPGPARRIGEDFGFGGEVWLVDTDGPRVVVKVESAVKAERGFTATTAVAEANPADVPAPLALWTDGDLGVTVSEFVAPAVQGDVLHACSDAQAGAIIDLTTRVHRLPPVDELPRFVLEPWDRERWRSRVATASSRFPRLLDEARSARLLDEFPGRVDEALDVLAGGRNATIHGDLHLDNVLWRPGVRPVLLDWSSASVGPPAIDLASLLVGGGIEGARPREVGRYAAALDLDPADVDREIDAALVWLTRAVVGGAGSGDGFAAGSRREAVMEHGLRELFAAVDG